MLVICGAFVCNAIHKSNYGNCDFNFVVANSLVYFCSYSGCYQSQHPVYHLHVHRHHSRTLSRYSVWQLFMLISHYNYYDYYYYCGYCFRRPVLDAQIAQITQRKKFYYGYNCYSIDWIVSMICMRVCEGISLSIWSRHTVSAYYQINCRPEIFVQYDNFILNT